MGVPCTPQGPGELGTRGSAAWRIGDKTNCWDVVLILFFCWVSLGKSDPLPCLSFPICKVSADPCSSEHVFSVGCQIPVPKMQVGSTWGKGSLTCGRGWCYLGVYLGVWRGSWRVHRHFGVLGRT